MVQGRKITGGKYKQFCKKKKHSLSRDVRKVKLKETEKQKEIRARGGTKRKVLLSTNKVNLLNPQTKKCSKEEILNVLETPSNRFFARQNILNKGAIIETKVGNAQITNRPSQEGSIQAILIQ